MAPAPGLGAPPEVSPTAPTLVAPGSVPKTNGPVTLEDALVLALARNWDLLATRADVDVATAGQWVARQFPNPTLSVSVTKAPINYQTAATPLGNGFFERSYDSIAAFNQLFEIGGKRSARRAAAAAGADAARARLSDARRQMNLGVTRAYVSALLAAENARILRATAASLRQEADIAETRLKAGDISRADRDQIEIAADRLDLDAVQAEAEAQGARIQLELLLGVPDAHGSLVLATSLVDLGSRQAEPPPVPGGLPADRPDILAARFAARQAAENVRLQRAQRIPDPTVLAQYEREPPDQTSTVGFGVSLPLPLWNRNGGGIATAEAQRQQAETNVRRVEAEAMADISTSLRLFETARARRERYVTQIVPRSAEIAQTVRFAYGKGASSLVDLLTAERSDNEVRLAAAAAAAELTNTRAALEAALNVHSIHEIQ